ncbi:hypothetical protein JCM8547_000078 [Rhodosporidiobolus lusitaniae]
MPRATSSSSTSPPPGRASSAAPGRATSAAPGDDDLFELDGKTAKQACEQCRRRKLKCSRSVPACSFCAEHAHSCVYSKIVRTPLTRKNLDAAEKQLQHVQEALARQGYSEADVKALLEGGRPLPRPAAAHEAPPLPAPQQTQQYPPAPPPPVPPVVPVHALFPTPASMPPPPPPVPAPVPQPPTFPISTSTHSPLALIPSSTFSPRSQNSPQLTQASSSPAQPFNAIASSSGTLHFNIPAHTSSAGDGLPSFSLSTPSTFIPRPSLASMATPFSSMSVPSAVEIPPPPAPPVQNSTPAEAAIEEQDGTGSLTVEAEGSSSYLGSLSGAALLHFLQRCAADVNLSVKGSGGNAASPSSTIGSQVNLNPEKLNRYVEGYFAVFALQYPLVHADSFRAQLAEIIPRPGGAAWNLLLACIQGLGSMCVLGETEGTDAIALYERACSLVQIVPMFEQTSLTAVQAFILLGNYAQKLNHPSSGSVFLGIALRLAINLGLHCEVSAQSMSAWEQEQRRRVWWTLFAFDSGAQLTFGHPSTLPITGVDVLPIINVADSSFTPSALTRPPSSDSYPTACSSLFYQVIFHQMANQAILFLSRPSISAQESLSLQADLQVLQSSLPPYFFSSSAPSWFDFARHKLAWRIDGLRMVILRQSFLKVSSSLGPVSPTEEEAWQECVRCASEVCRSVSRFTESGTKTCMEWWYALHFVFPAVFVPLIALRVRPASPAAVDWVIVIQSTKVVLERVPYALLKGLANRGLSILNAVANLDAKDPDKENATQDIDFSAFLEMLGGPTDFDATATTSTGLPAPGVLPDLDLPTFQLFQWFNSTTPGFTPAGSPSHL